MKIILSFFLTIILLIFLGSFAILSNQKVYPLSRGEELVNSILAKTSKLIKKNTVLDLVDQGLQCLEVLFKS